MQEIMNKSRLRLTNRQIPLFQNQQDNKREKLVAYLFMLLAVPIAGELKFYPVEGDIRVSLGTPIFFFILLSSRKINPFTAGFLVGAAVVLFRVLLYGIGTESFIWQNALSLHFPAFFYYVVFALFFTLFRLNQLYDYPFLIGVLGVIIEILASLVEISFRYFFSHMPLTLSALLLIGGIAIIRSFFVLGFFNILMLREAKLAEEQQRRRTEQVLLLVSNLYVEAVQLKNSTKYAEELTSTCYNLYRDLKAANKKEAQTALKIAGQMHEIKKDAQRIYAGLSRLMRKEDLDDFMKMKEIVQVVIYSNKSYSKLLGKSIQFHISVDKVDDSYHSFTLLSLLNNLIANAVEAIVAEGMVELKIEIVGDMLQMTVSDNGSGISEKNKPFIFKPGFTTKYDQSGFASNGIGLSYIKNVIEEHGGEILLLQPTDNYQTIFNITLPNASLTERG
jgi:two-component system, sensor histidine kinase YcbA